MSQKHPPRRSPAGRLAARCAAAALVAGVAGVAAAAWAEDLPAFRKGMWEFNRTVDTGTGKPQLISNKECTDPTAAMRKQNDMLTKAGCKFSSVTRSGGAYTFTSDCAIQGVTAQSKSVLTPGGDSAYTVDVESRQGGVTSRERLVAKRVGDC